MNVTLKICFALLFSFLSAATLSATPINYPGPDEGLDGPGGMTGWMGDTVWYAGVSESNSAGVSRFGAPVSITGNSIDFDPQNFEASTSGPASEIVDSQLNFMVFALPNTVINNLQFSEAGDTSLFAFAPDQAFTSVTASIFVEVLHIDGTPWGGTPINLNASMIFTPSNGDYQVGVDGAPAINEIWTGTVIVDIDAGLTANGLVKGVDYDLGATKLGVAVDNTLTAGSSGSATAFIRKKDFDGLTVTTNVPEPTTMFLALVGLMPLGAMRRR